MHLALHHPGVRLPESLELGAWFAAQSTLSHGEQTAGRNELELMAAHTIAVDDSVQAAYQSGPGYFKATYAHRLGEWIDQAALVGHLRDGFEFVTCDGAMRESFISHAADAAYAAVTEAIASTYAAA